MALLGRSRPFAPHLNPYEWNTIWAVQTVNAGAAAATGTALGVSATVAPNGGADGGTGATGTAYGTTETVTVLLGSGTATGLGNGFLTPILAGLAAATGTAYNYSVPGVVNPATATATGTAVGIVMATGTAVATATGTALGVFGQIGPTTILGAAATGSALTLTASVTADIGTAAATGQANNLGGSATTAVGTGIANKATPTVAVSPVPANATGTTFGFTTPVTAITAAAVGAAFNAPFAIVQPSAANGIGIAWNAFGRREPVSATVTVVGDLTATVTRIGAPL